MTVDEGGVEPLAGADAGAALAAMAPRDKRYAASLIEAGIMPKAPRKLDAAEKASVVEFLRK